MKKLLIVDRREEFTYDGAVHFKLGFDVHPAFEVTKEVYDSVQIGMTITLELSI